MRRYKCIECNMKLDNVPDNLSPRFCPFCTGSLVIDELSEDWMQNIYDDDSLWYFSGFSSLPSIIAHEYWRMRDMFRAKQPYGVYFQIRDLAETILKFEVLSICAWADASKITGFREQVGCLITTRSLSMGAWYELARRIQTFFYDPAVEPLPTVFSAVLDGIIREYGSGSEFVKKHPKAKSLLNWRNEKIGHGALGFADDEEFRMDIRIMIEYFKCFFETRIKRTLLTIGEALTQQKLFLNNLVLMGYECARSLPEEDSELHICIEGMTLDFPLAPYIVYNKGSIYFFDNQKALDCTQRQCYMNGQRINEAVSFFNDLLRMNTNADLEDDIAAQTRIKAEDDLLNRISVAPKYTKPHHLVIWLKDKLVKHDRGIFYLRMPRGMGKSTFSEKLNCLYENPTKILDDVDVRTYHISRSQMINADDFTRHIEEQWRHDYENQSEWVAYTHISTYISKYGLKADEALSRYLNDCRNFSRLRRRKNRILLVIDGLDEIVDKTLWEFLPDPEQLGEGVYLLLTSRDPEIEELPENVTRALSGIDVTEMLTVDSEDEDNILFLKQYIDEHIDKEKRVSLKPAAYNALIRRAKYRVLSLGLLCKLLNADYPLDVLPDDEIPIEKYLELLFASYGDKEAFRLRELLSVICTIGSEEPLSLRELAGLLNDGQLSLSLLGKMNDISPLLKTQRGYMANGHRYTGENRYGPVNQEVADYIRKFFPEWKNVTSDLLDGVYKSINTDNNVNSKNEEINGILKFSADDEMSLLVLAHADICGGKVKTVRFSDLNKSDLFLLKFAETSEILFADRVIKAMKYIADMVCQMVEQGVLGNVNYLGELYVNMGVILARLNRLAEAEAFYQRALGIYHSLQERHLPADVTGIFSAQMNYGILKGMQGDIRGEIEWLTGDVSFLQLLVEQGQAPNTFFVADLYTHLAEAYNNDGRAQDAIDIYKLAKQLREKNIKAGFLNDLDNLASVCNGMGIAYQAVRQYDEALGCYKEALAIREKIKEEDVQDNLRLTGILHMNTGLLYDLRGDKEAAMREFDIARQILEQLDEKGLLIDRTDLATVLYNKAKVLYTDCESEKPRLDEAFELCKQAEDICNTLQDRDCLYRQDFYYGGVCIVLAGLLSERGSNDDAIAYLKKGIGGLEVIDAENRLYDHSLLAKAYINLAQMLESLERNSEASIQIEKAERVCENMKQKGELDLREGMDLVLQYITRFKDRQIR